MGKEGRLPAKRLQRRLSRRAFLRQALFVAAFPSIRQTFQPGPVLFAWSGAVTPTSALVKVKVREGSQAVRLLVSPQADLSPSPDLQIYTAPSEANYPLLSFSITNLRPDTRYYYGVEVAGQVDDTKRGQFKTFPIGPASFTFAFGSCAETGSAHPIFETIARVNPLFFIHLGDMHYQDIPFNDPALFGAAYETVLASPTQAALYRNVPLVYMWDDHDYGPNDSDALAPGRTAARLTYQAYVPHYPLAAGEGDVPLYHAFTVGRVRFIVTDLRSERSPKSMPDDVNKTMMGTAQKAWFKEELLRSKYLYSLVVWVSTTAWIPALSDGWQLYSTERRELADFIAANGPSNLIMLTGDLHMLGIDDGRHSDFSTGGGAGFPVMQASPLDRFGFQEGMPFAPYSQGVVAERGQFGVMTVIDDGGPQLTVRLSGRNAANEALMEYTFPVSNSRFFIPPISYLR